MNFKISNTKQEVAVNFSSDLANLIRSKKEVHIALSGGSTPKIVFDELANNFKDKIDWRKVHLYWGDERCVDPTNDDSNYKMTRSHLISKINIPKENIHRIKGENEPNYETKRYSELLQHQLPLVNNIPCFDLIILGMGDDGHTASIFPHEIALWHSDNFCEVANHPVSGQKRITLTGKVINNAQLVTFLVTGTTKEEKVYEIVKNKNNSQQYPAALVNPTGGKLIWFLDQQAAAKIT